MSAEKRSISAPDTLFAQADVRKAQLGYSTFSDYIQALIRADAVGGGAHLREAASSVATLTHGIVSDAISSAAATPTTAPVSYQSKRSTVRRSKARRAPDSGKKAL